MEVNYYDNFLYIIQGQYIISYIFLFIIFLPTVTFAKISFEYKDYAAAHIIKEMKSWFADRLLQRMASSKFGYHVYGRHCTRVLNKYISSIHPLFS